MISSYNKTGLVQLNFILNNSDKVLDQFEKHVIDNHKDESLITAPIKILDIGCSHGRNSIQQVTPIISKIKSQLKDNKLVEVYYADQPNNHFTLLYNELIDNKELPANQNNNVFSYVIGNNFVNQLMPNESIDFIFSYFTFHWVPLLKDYHQFEGSFCTITQPKTLPGFDDYYKDRLLTIFRQRLVELKYGGVFVTTFLVIDNEDVKSLKIAYYHLKEILREMHYDGLLSKEEVEKMVLPVRRYTKEEYEYVIDNITKFKNNGGSRFKLISKAIKQVNWKEHAISASPNEDPVVAYVESMMSYTGSTIKDAIEHDGEDCTTIGHPTSRKELVYNEFKNRLLEQVRLYPTKFDFSISYILLSFTKEQQM